MHDQEPSTLDDDALIRAVAGGDRRAFHALVERHWAPLYRFLVAMIGVREPAAAEDALQEAFTAVWTHAGTYRGESRGRTWLYTIARNAVSHRYRRRENRPELAVSLDASLDELGVEAGFGDLTSGERVLRAIEDRDRVRKALGALSPGDREIVTLIDVEELTAEEAASALEIGVAALKSRLHRARLRLMAELRKEVSDEG